MSTTITAKELAQAVGTDPKTLRRFLRATLRAADQETPGQGGRYAFTKSEAKSLAKAFTAWSAPKVKAPVIEDEDTEMVDEDLDFELSDDEDEDTEDDVEDEVDEDEDEDEDAEV